ncbi:MAG TPA: hypothetical protein VGM51_16535 [Armatimonadota bacterium]|jgi:hypothetical protein
MEMGYGWRRTVATVVTLGILSPMLAGCGGRKDESNQSGNAPGSGPSTRQGLTRGQKTALLVGAAALYYVYQHRQKAPETAKTAGATGQLYRSEATGGIYYRDAQGNAHWVSPPKGGIQVPQQEAQSFQTRYRDEISRTKFKDNYQPLALSPDEQGQSAQ